MDEYMSRRRVWGLTCPGSLEEIGRARRWTRDILSETRRVDDAALIVTELGTNALLHTASGHWEGSFRITLTRVGRAVSISVSDCGGTPATPHVASPSDDDPGGRGLRLVTQLADRVEVEGNEHGPHGNRPPRPLPGRVVNPILTPGFINDLASWTWLENTAVGPVAFLLLAHPQAAAVEGQLARLADGLGLVEPRHSLPDTGERVRLLGSGRAAVRVDGCTHLVQVEVGHHWAQFTRAGGPIALLVGLASLARCAPPDEVESYLGQVALDGRLRLGTSSARGEP
jgi:anti-sigma regulatory factor (Ser/Thr protein kinase)